MTKKLDFDSFKCERISEEKQIIVSTQSVELLKEFDVDDDIAVNRRDGRPEFRRLQEQDLKEWLETEYTLGDLWKKNILGADSQNEECIYCEG